MSDEEIYYDEHWSIIDKPLESIKREQGVDCHGNILHDGDTIVAIKGLAVKGGTNIKKGDKFTNIRLGDDITHVSANQ